MTMSKYAKAIYGMLTAVIGSVALLLAGSADTLADVTQGEWFVVAGEALAVLGVVYQVTNKTKLDTTTY